MKKVKYMIIALVIIMVIIGIMLLVIKTREKNNKENLITDIEYEVENDNYSEIQQINEYLEIKKCVSIYLSYLNVNAAECYGYDEDGNYINLASDEDINSNIINLLSDEYINKNSISISNVRNYIYQIEDESFFIPLEIISKGNSDNVKTFGVYGLIETQDFVPITECFLIVNIDENNMTFSIEQFDNKDEIYNVKVNIPNEIQEKDNNVFSELGLIQEELIQEYINDFKRLALAYPDKLYNDFLDEEYRNKRYGNLEAFRKYISENKDRIESINLEKYQVTDYVGYTQYYAIDENGKYYIFNAENPAKYKILLDTYTIDLPEFTEKYNSATEQQKVALNIDKFMQAINAKDYKYAYGCLADSFKNNYFKTQAEFENYAKENFFEINTIEYNEFNTQGDVYTYSVILKDKSTGDQKAKTFIMRLGEGTDFEMSFNR